MCLIFFVLCQSFYFFPSQLLLISMYVHHLDCPVSSLFVLRAKPFRHWGIKMRVSECVENVSVWKVEGWFMSLRVWQTVSYFVSEIWNSAQCSHSKCLLKDCIVQWEFLSWIFWKRPNHIGQDGLHLIGDIKRLLTQIHTVLQ